MNLQKQILLFLVSTTLLFSCQTEDKYSSATRDFRPALQSHLSKIVTTGMLGAGSSDTFLEKHTTDKELIRLSKSEQPILRAAALRAMMHRPSIDHFKVLMAHLDDTATLIIDISEFDIPEYGKDINFSTVADDLLQHSEWNTMADKNKTIDKVLSEHNYLSAAYRVLLSIEPQDQYYIYIKAMAQRRRLFHEVEYALYRLASYRKAEDIEGIKRILLQHCYQLGNLSFRLMKEYPNDAYLEVLKEYNIRYLFRNICRNRAIDDAQGFIDAVASYKQKESAEILQSISKELPTSACTLDKSTLRQSLSFAVWNNQCDAYARLISQLKPYILEYEENKKHYMQDAEVGQADMPKSITW